MTRPGRLLLVAAVFVSGTASGYPIDGYKNTGIARLEGYRRGQEGQVRGADLPPGARLPLAEVDIRLRGIAPIDLPPTDPELGRALRRLLGDEAPIYGVTLLDLTDPAHPRYAEHRGEARFNPASVGKIVIALALFQALADIYPDDLATRQHTLRDSAVVADRFIRSDHHTVPFWSPGEPAIERRPLREGDQASLWAYLDWMLSASSNAAASMVIQHLLLVRHFGAAYPVSAERAREFLDETSRTELSDLLIESLQVPVKRNGLDLQALRQGGFFTAEGKRRIPGASSVATSRELMRFLLKLEQGRLVDPFSSREIKRLLYQTERRIRYASSPALLGDAVYFKSGSLYRCRPEPGFECVKYRGNVENMMNSVAIVESPAHQPRLHYLVAVTSNVLRKNSAVEHQTLATRVHRLIESLHASTPPPTSAARGK